MDLLVDFVTSGNITNDSMSGVRGNPEQRVEPAGEVFIRNTQVVSRVMDVG